MDCEGFQGRSALFQASDVRHSRPRQLVRPYLAGARFEIFNDLFALSIDPCLLHSNQVLLYVTLTFYVRHLLLIESCVVEIRVVVSVMFW